MTQSSGLLWPNPQPSENLASVLGNKRVCVVGVVGKSSSRPATLTKGALVSTLVDVPYTTQADVKRHTESEGGEDSRDESIAITWHKDPQRDVVYLVLNSIDDSDALVSACEQALLDIENSSLNNSDTPQNGLKTHKNRGGLHEWLEGITQKHAKALLFLFLSCHVVVITHPTPAFDLSYVRILRALQQTKDYIRSSIVMAITAELVESDLGKLSLETSKNVPSGAARPSKTPDAALGDGWVAGRCCPTLAFVLQVLPTANGHHVLGSDQAAREKFQEALEGQIRRILRKTRVTTDVAPSERGNVVDSQLFTLPTRDFVHLYVHKDGSDARVAGQVFDVVQFLMSLPDRPITNGRKQQAPVEDTGVRRFVHQKISTVDPSITTTTTIPVANPYLFFDDAELFSPTNTNTNTNTASRLPLAPDWVRSTSALVSLFMDHDKEGKARRTGGLAGMERKLGSLLDAAGKYSEYWCEKALPAARDAYMADLPTHYPQAVHEQRLAHAVQVLMQQGRGPACDRYVARLQTVCRQEWLRRMQCEARSLTNRPCIKPVHPLLDDTNDVEPTPTDSSSARPSTRLRGRRATRRRGGLESDGGGSKEPPTAHTSSYRVLGGCNCGLVRRARPDPFSMFEANWSSFEQPCCEQSERTTYPLSVHLPRGWAPSENTSRPKEPTQPASTQASRLALAQSARTGDEQTQGVNSEQQQNEAPPIAEKETEDGETIANTNTETAEGSTENGGDAGRQDGDPAWCLTVRGSAQQYDPAVGLDQAQGYLAQASMLLPVEISTARKGFTTPADGKTTSQAGPSTPQSPTLRAENLNDGATDSPWKGRKFLAPVTSRPRPRDVTPRLDRAVLTEKLYIGAEYDCPLGHRFVCSGPDRLPQRTGTRETGEALLTSPLPIHTTCPCGSAGSWPAVLQRIHVITPRAPFKLRLKPKVCFPLLKAGEKEAEGGEVVFRPGGQPIMLPSDKWVCLRLPFVYGFGSQTLYPPSQPNTPGRPYLAPHWLSVGVGAEEKGGQ